MQSPFAWRRCKPGACSRIGDRRLPQFLQGGSSMKRFTLSLLLTLGAMPAFAQAVPEIRFDADTEFLKLPADMYLGEAAGVAVNSQGHVFVFHRGNTNGPAF